MRRLAIVSCVGLVLFGSTVALRLAIGDEVVDNAVIAHKRLKELYVAVQIYWNDNELQLDDPLRLVDDSNLSPEVFWHPGDSDPAPTVIDNSIANAPNSAQISFLFQTGTEEFSGDDFLIWDASPWNNAGRFSSFITADGSIETIPHVDLPVPTNVSIAQAHLKRISRALNSYQSDYFEIYPDSLGDLMPSSQVKSPRSFWNPGDADPMPTAITNDLPDALNSASISFDYLVAGMTYDDVTSETIMLRDNSPANNDGLGINIVLGPLHYAGSVRFIPTDGFGDINGDDRIDLADWAKLQWCHSGWFDEVTDDSCRVLDFDYDGNITFVDNASFLDVMTGPVWP